MGLSSGFTETWQKVFLPKVMASSAEYNLTVLSSNFFSWRHNVKRSLPSTKSETMKTGSFKCFVHKNSLAKVDRTT